MNFNNLFQFLTELNQNNSKEWMDKNRKWYQEVRDQYIQWLNEMDQALASLDNDYYPTPGKKGINRINNNLMFHPNKPIYKDHFGAGLDKAPNSGDFYIEIGLGQSMLAGGIWRPDAKTLRSIRDAIDYDGEELQRILNKTSFKKAFGDLVVDHRLIKAPKGFSNEHPHIDLLRNKTFAVTHPLSQDDIFELNFKEKVISVYREMLPFRRYLNKAVTV
ncbi:hypothetical protein KCTC52924_00101 [Arenibacter antarcticus]|uniref:DUF2461 domain-containing protein n=1 Tax=Arenibacter antarcticus TaxID=2040469 RepID=A0ABW5VKK5_9FLAO|nr:DUF2461 domain-containing protein [Arenibacter sp. H213]MCM4169132.1 TIGR02453 family protein [Arenibacter sp. H213]